MTLDFEDVAVGEIVTDQYLERGVRFSLAGGAVPAGPTVTSISPTVYPVTGPNVLAPSTTTSGVFADLVIDFVVPVDYVALWAFDIDEPLTMLVYSGGVLVASRSNTLFGDVASERFEFGAVGGGLTFDRLVVDVNEGAPGSLAGGPEYYDGLVYNLTAPLPQPVPEPRALAFAGLLALLLGLRGLCSGAAAG